MSVSICDDPVSTEIAFELVRRGVDVYRRPVTADRHTWAVYGEWYSERNSDEENRAKLARLRALPRGATAEDALRALGAA